MNLNLEANDTNAIQSYCEDTIQINSIIYEKSLIVSRNQLITDVAIRSIVDLDQHYIDLLLQFKPEVILIGHKQNGTFPSMALISQIGQLQIGFESMSLGAAARTYNILLSEQRKVVAGFIF